MRAGLLFANLALCFLLFAGCATSGKSKGYPLPPILEVSEEVSRYNLQFDFRKNHFSGMLVVRRTAPEEIRIVAATHFGLSLFDFSLTGEKMIVNSCIEPMKKEKLLKLLESDFKVLFLSGNSRSIKEKSATFERRKQDKGFGKKIIELHQFSDKIPEQVVIRHPWLKLKIQLDPLEKH